MRNALLAIGTVIFLAGGVTGAAAATIDPASGPTTLTLRADGSAAERQQAGTQAAVIQPPVVVIQQPPVVVSGSQQAPVAVAGTQTRAASLPATNTAGIAGLAPILALGLFGTGLAILGAAVRRRS